MALFNEILSGRLNRAIQKVTGIKGSPPAPQLSSEFMPVFPFFWGAEMRYLEGWIMHSWSVIFAGSPAQLNAAMLRNPVGSGVVAVFVKISATSLLSDQFIMSAGPRTTDLPTPNPMPVPSNFDLRFGSTSRSNLISSIQQAAGPGTAAPDRGFFGVAASGTYDIIVDGSEEFPLLPGGAVSLRNNIVNQTNGMAFWWRERPLEDSELT